MGITKLSFKANHMQVSYHQCHPSFKNAVLSRTTTYGHSQLKCLKLRVGGSMKEVLKWFNYPPARAHPGCEVSCQGVPNQLVLSLWPCFVKASPTVEEAVMCYKANQLVGSLPIFRSIQLSFAVREFHAAGEEHCERGHEQVCANLISWHPKRIRTIADMWTQWTYLRIYYARI